MVPKVNLGNSMHRVILGYKRDYCVVMYRNYICNVRKRGDSNS